MIDRAKLEEAIRMYRKELSDASRQWDKRDVCEALVLAAEAHLATLPRIKMVDVWYVHSAVLDHGKWHPHICLATSLEQAERWKTERPVSVWKCVRVTGPHQHEVPT